MCGEFNNFWCKHGLLILKGFHGKKTIPCRANLLEKGHLLSPFIFRKKPYFTHFIFFHIQKLKHWFKSFELISLNVIRNLKCLNIMQFDLIII